MRSNLMDRKRLSNAVSRSLAVALVLAMQSACALESGDMGGDDIVEYDQTGREIRYGIETTHRGVIEIGGCTGAIINSQYAITAAHCIPEYTGATRQGWIYRTVRHFGNNSSGDALVTNAQLYAWVVEAYSGEGDISSDLALVRYSPGWPGLNTSDYLRLSLGSCAQMDINNLYGRGYQGFDGSGSGILRYMPVNIKACFTHYFYDLEGTRATCRGDSGGPHIVQLSTTEVVAGLHSSSEKPYSGSQNCTLDGGKQYAMRMNTNKVGWIESKMGFSCNQYIVSGHSYKRCW